MELILYTVLGAVLSGGLLMMLYKKLMGVVEKKVLETENKYDDIILLLKPQLDKLVIDGEVKLKEYIDKKLNKEKEGD